MDPIRRSIPFRAAAEQPCIRSFLLLAREAVLDVGANQDCISVPSRVSICPTQITAPLQARLRRSYVFFRAFREIGVRPTAPSVARHGRESVVSCSSLIQPIVPERCTRKICHNYLKGIIGSGLDEWL